jgi:hypothetical protein
VTCEHRFVPFPGSRSRLYCEYCGIGKDAFAPVARPSTRRTRAEKTTVTQELPPLPLFEDRPDADVDAARDVLAQREAVRDLETRTREIIAAQNPDLDEQEVEALVAQVMDFGPAVDLDQFAASVAAMEPRDRRQPVDESDEVLGRGAGL